MTSTSRATPAADDIESTVMSSLSIWVVRPQGATGQIVNINNIPATNINLETFTEEESNDLFVSLIKKLQYYPLSQGRDHVFVWGSGYGVDGPFRDWKKYIKDSIFLMTETEYMTL